MNTYDLLETKRKQVFNYSDKIPDKGIIEDALYKAWKTTPSKNNAMAYEVVVWGPDKKSEKQILYNLTQKSCIETEKIGLKEGLAVSVSTGNKYFEHIRTNPYMFTFHQRLATPNEYHKESIEKKGMFFDQAHKSHMSKIIDSVAVEVGLFAQILTNNLLEEGLDVSYNSCFTREVKYWQKWGLTNITTRPILMLSCGYGEIYRRNHMGSAAHKGDVKPEHQEIITWV